MKCIVKQFAAEIENNNLPVLDLTVANYIKAIGKSEYEDKVSELYGTLKNLGVLGYFDAVMPILGDTPDKAMLNLLNPTKYYSYPDDLAVNSNKIVSEGSTTLINGNMPTKTYGVGDWSVIAVFNGGTGTKEIISSNATNIAIYNSSNIINYGEWKDVSALSENEAYFNAIFNAKYVPDAGQYIAFSIIEDDYSSKKYTIRTNDSYAAITDGVSVMAQTETCFVAIMNKSLTTLDSTKAQAIFDAITSFLSDVKGISIHQNS